MPFQNLGKRAPKANSRPVFDADLMAPVDGGKLGAGTVATVALADGSVTTAKLHDDSVTTDKIAPGAVHTDDLHDGAVTADKIDPNERQNFRLRFAANTKCSPATTLTFGTIDYGSHLLGSNAIGMFADAWVQVHIRLAFAGGDSVLELGARGQVQLIDTATGKPVAASAWTPATVDDAGDVQLVLELLQIVRLLASTTYTVQYVGQLADGSSLGDWGLLAAALGSSPYDSGSFLEGTTVLTTSG